MHSGSETREFKGSQLHSRLQEQIGGSFRILDLIGTRGQELLLHARDVEQEADVVIRALPLDDVLVPGALEHFAEEVAIASTLEHPTIVNVSALQRRDDLAFCVERGRAVPSLESKLREGHVFSIEEARLIVDDVALALDHAHAQNVVHGALVPALIFLRTNGGARVAGFGEGRPGRASRRSESPAYMAPEQWQHEPHADARADIYALGVIAFELFTGRRRAISTHVPGVTIIDPLLLNQSAPLRQELGLNVNAGILRATSKAPSRRFASAGEFAAMVSEPPPAMIPDVSQSAEKSTDAAPSRFSVQLGTIVAVVGVVLGMALVPLARRLHAMRLTYSVLTQGIDMTAIQTLTFSSPNATTSVSQRPPAPPIPTVLPGPGRAPRLTSETSEGGLSSTSESSGFGMIDVEFEGGPTTVMIDGIPRGETPFLVRVPVGEHTVKLVGLPATDPSDRRVRIASGDSVLAAFRVPR